MERLKVHLDTDIGGDLDDLCALALLLQWPHLEITGVTTVLEHDGKRAGYARYVLDLAGRTDVPVAAGSDVRLGRFQLEAGLPPEERYWPNPVPPVPGPVEAALDLLEQSIDRQAVVVAIGPVTNLALLEARHPGTLRQATVVMMGGHVNPAPPGFPPWKHEMDYNVQADPLAARQVLEVAQTTIVPIEVTVQTALRRSHLPTLAGSGPLGALVAHQAEVFARHERIAERLVPTCPALPTDIVNFQHDPLACAVALGWDGVTIERVPVSLEMDGRLLRTRIDPPGRPLRVVTAVDREQFATFWLDTVAR